MSFDEADYQSAADKLGTDVAAIKAVAEVESNGVTNWPDGRPPILFEAHWFGKLTGYRFNDSHPGISSRAWNRALYIGGPKEYGRLEEARALDENAALQSASYGAFQVMGFNFHSLGFSTVQDMVAAMQTAAGQLDCFVRFIEANPPIKYALQQHDWDDFSARYNGPGAIDTYAPKIRAAYERHAA